MGISREFRNEVFSKVKELFVDDSYTFERIRLVDGNIDRYHRINFMVYLSSLLPIDESVIKEYQVGLNTFLANYNLVCSFHNGYKLYQTKNVTINNIKYKSTVIRIYLRNIV